MSDRYNLDKYPLEIQEAAAKALADIHEAVAQATLEDWKADVEARATDAQRSSDVTEENGTASPNPRTEL
jgi:hypothetical protein